jgi:hypothetical protein
MLLDAHHTRQGRRSGLRAELAFEHGVPEVAGLHRLPPCFVRLLLLLLLFLLLFPQFPFRNIEQVWREWFEEKFDDFLRKMTQGAWKVQEARSEKKSATAHQSDEVEEVGGGEQLQQQRDRGGGCGRPCSGSSVGGERTEVARVITEEKGHDLLEDWCSDRGETHHAFLALLESAAATAIAAATAPGESAAAAGRSSCAWSTNAPLQHEANGFGGRTSK